MQNDKQQRIHEAIKENEKKLTPKQQKQLQDALQKLTQEKVPLKQVMGITPEIEETIYVAGYNLFQSGKYKEALKIFYSLVQLNNTYRYNFAIAAAHQYAKEYTDAIGSYLICTQIEPENPVPFFHLYDCCMKSKNHLFAEVFLLNAIEMASKNPEYAKLKERAQLELEHLRQQT
jgi:type III secretion system low calcium response chaperone LcrH/SycD